MAGEASRGSARQGLVMRGMARRVMAGEVWLGRHGKERIGMSRPGVVTWGKSRQVPVRSGDAQQAWKPKQTKGRNKNGIRMD